MVKNLNNNFLWFNDCCVYLWGWQRNRTSESSPKQEPISSGGWLTTVKNEHYNPTFQNYTRPIFRTVMCHHTPHLDFGIDAFPFMLFSHRKKVQETIKLGGAKAVSNADWEPIDILVYYLYHKNCTLCRWKRSWLYSLGRIPTSGPCRTWTYDLLIMSQLR